MTTPGTETSAARLRLCLEMFELGESIMLARLRREHPTASEEELEARMRQWLRTRPGAELGDAGAKVASRPGIGG